MELTTFACVWITIKVDCTLKTELSTTDKVGLAW